MFELYFRNILSRETGILDLSKYCWVYSGETRKAHPGYKNPGNKVIQNTL